MNETHPPANKQKTIAIRPKKTPLKGERPQKKGRGLKKILKK